MQIKRESGKISILMSKSLPDPTLEAYDEVFNKDNFVITDGTTYFKEDFIFFSIIAIEDSEFFLSLNYGNEKHSKNPNLKYKSK